MLSAGRGFVLDKNNKKTVKELYKREKILYNYVGDNMKSMKTKKEIVQMLLKKKLETVDEEEC